MPGYHVVVYCAPLPRYAGGGTLQPPGYLYFVSTSSQQLKDYEVYSQFGPNKFPLTRAHYHGSVKKQRRGDVLTRAFDPWNFEVYYYMKDYAGAVDCYVWRPGHSPTEYAYFRVSDITSPRDWFYARGYDWVGFHSDTAISSRIRGQGLRRFYRCMQPPLWG